MADNRNRNYRGKKTQAAAPESVFVENLLQGIGQVLAYVFKSIFGKRSSGPSTATKQRLAEFQEHWGQVELHATQEATFSLAISEGDKILDNAMKILGFSGDTMADRLRSAEGRLGTELYQKVWQAHKLRNTLAHEVGARVSRQEVQASVTTFRTALYQLGVFE